MVNSSIFPDPYGWNYVTNTSEFNPIQAAVHAYTDSAGSGIAWTFAATSIILLIPIMIYVRTQNIIAAVFGMILINAFMQYYGMMPMYIVFAIYAIAVVGIGLAIAFKWLAKKGE